MSVTIADQIRDLIELKNSGAISEEEFLTLKGRILDFSGTPGDAQRSTNVNSVLPQRAGSHGLYSILVATLVSILSVNVLSLIDDLYLPASADDALGYVYLAVLLVIMLLAIALFFSRRANKIVWISPHVERTWAITKLFVYSILFAVVLEIAGSVGTTSSESESNAGGDLIVSLFFLVVFVPRVIFSLISVVTANYSTIRERGPS